MKDCCENCPMYWSSCDYWGEWDEGCELHYCGWFYGRGYKLICYMPNFIKKIYLKYYRWREEIRWEKFLREQAQEEELDDISEKLEKIHEESLSIKSALKEINDDIFKIQLNIAQNRTKR